MENIENNIETVETEVVDLEPDEIVVPSSKLSLDPDAVKGVVIIGGLTILAWEGIKAASRVIGKTKLAQDVKEKIKGLKKQKPVDESDELPDGEPEENAE